MARRRSPRLHSQIHASGQVAGMTRRRSPRLHPQIHAGEGGVTLTCRIRRRSGKSLAEPACLPDDDGMLWEILLRLPPLPSSLLRASAVCKRWRGLVTDPRFHRQLYAHHRKPPLLGVFSRRNLGRGIVFNPILDPPDRIPPRCFNLGRCSSRGGYDLLDCRHGLVLVKNMSQTEFTVCDPITSERRRLAIPPKFEMRFINGAVICAAGDQGHVHGSCHSSPFKVVLMSGHNQYTVACVYSSETGIWSNLISTEPRCKILGKPAVLVGNCLYWLCMGDDIVGFDLGEHSLTVIRGPPVTNDILYKNRQIIQAEHGAVGYATLSYLRFNMWQRKFNDHGVATWVPWKTIEMRSVLELPPQTEEMMALLLGYDDDTDAIFLSAGGNNYMVQLNSMQSRKLYETTNTYRCHPFKSFYTPAIAGGFNGAEMLHIG